MRTQNDTASVFVRHDKRRLQKNPQCPIVISVYYRGVPRNYSTGLKCTVEEWDTMNKGGLSIKDSILKKMWGKITQAKTKADNIVEMLDESFSFESFDELYLDADSKKGRLNAKVKEELRLKEAAEKEAQTNALDMFVRMKKHIEEMKEQNRSLGAIEIHTSALNKLKKFRPTLKVTEITPKFLESFEAYLLNEHKYRYSTVGMRMREIRIIINEAIDQGIIPQEKYPFGQKAKRKYEIPESEENHRALEPESVQAVLNYVPQSDVQQKAKDYWIFTLYCNGINMRDICQLKYSDIDQGFLNFRRNKTRRKRKQGRPIEVFITPMMAEIIDRQGNPDKANDNYLFPIMRKDKSDNENYVHVSTHLDSVNKTMKKIGKILGIDLTLTTMIARHTWATTLQQAGVPESYISKGLGHSSVAVTQHYLSGFNRRQKVMAANILENAINNKPQLLIDDK